MTRTPLLALPLLQPAQAQKHVTVNEALARLDALSMLVLEARGANTPPAEAEEGATWGLGVDPTGDWAGQGGRIAIRLGGGWVFATPRRGWRAWISEEGAQAVFDGAAWRGGVLALSPSGAGSFMRVKEFEHVVAPGSVSQSDAVIPANVLVLAVTARVTQSITGSLATWRLGVAGAPDRYGSGLGREVGAFARGLLGTPMAHYAATPLVLSATGGSFAGGRVRIAVHYYEPSLPGL
ncbi:DUF2793 domain-containing protein [Rhodobaculum claviforme]|nr:DUF2793 domain-containing protein [Rhodobaculum claviforme]